MKKVFSLLIIAASTFQTTSLLAAETVNSGAAVGKSAVKMLEQQSQTGPSSIVLVSYGLVIFGIAYLALASFLRTTADKQPKEHPEY